MNSVIYSLFISLALRMTVITAFVMLIKIVFRQKLSAAAHCGIWLIPVIQSLFCLGNVSIPAKTSIYNMEAATHVQQLVTETTAGTAGVDIRNVIALVYFIGVVAALIWYVSIFFIHRHRVIKAEDVTDNMTRKILDDVKCRLELNAQIRLKRGDYAHTLLDMVVLPEGYSTEEQYQILLHELCHYKHKDNTKLWLAVLVICLNWFNPFVWCAFKRFRSDIEMYCDDSVLKLTPSRKEYAKVLVKTASDHIRFVPGASSAANGTHEVARRVKRIIGWKKKKPVWLVIALFACVTASCMCLTDAVTNAVENTVEVTATPEPVEVVPAIVNAIKATAEPTEAPQDREERDEPEPRREAVTEAPKAEPAPAVQPVREPEPARVNEPVATEPAAPVPEMHTPKTAAPIPEELGEPDDISANGSKATYTLEDGRTAVLHYENGELETGYIISDEIEQDDNAAESEAAEPVPEPEEHTEE